MPLSFRRFLAPTTVFLAGAATMMIELAGSRVLAPYLGSSLIVWTSLIGLVLGCLSLGYIMGGRIADTKPNAVSFSFLFFSISIWLIGVVLYKDFFLNALTAHIADIRLSSIVAALFLFGYPNIALGMITPLVGKQTLSELASSGQVIGNLSAISTIGSIVGTFATGFFLMTFMGSRAILIVVAGILGFIGILHRVHSWKQHILWTIIWIVFLVMIRDIAHATDRLIPGLVASIDTTYTHARVMDLPDTGTGRTIRALMTDPDGVQTGIYLDNPDELYAEYLAAYRHAAAFVPRIETALMIGGAGYSYPRDFVRDYPTATMDVVDIDPEMHRIARDYFAYTPHERIRSITADGRQFLRANTTTYDIIFLDAFSHVFSIPYQLTTREAALLMHDRLSDDGVLAINIVSAITGRQSRFLHAYYHTLRAVFPTVHVLPLQPDEPTSFQNIVLFADKHPAATATPPISLPFTPWKNPIPPTEPILTDDFAPIDTLLLPALLTS